MSELPNGWAETKLGNTISLNYGKSLPATVRDGGQFAVFGSNGIVGYHSEAITGAPAIVVGRKGSFGEVHFSEDACFPIDTTYYVDGFSTLDARFAFHLLRHLPLTEMNRASAIPGLNREDAYGLDIALPPLPEQRRIVGKVDGLTARTARARKELDRIPTLIARYKQRLLALAFSGELIGGDFDGSQVSLSSVVMRLDQGWSPKCENFPSEDPSIWGVIKTTAIQPVEFLEHENKQLPAHLEPRPRIEISAGEVLVTRAGPRNRVGIACYVRKTRPRLMLADKVYRLAIDPAKADPLYVTYMLNSPDALSIIEAMKSGGSESGLNLTQDKFLGLAIPVPSIPEQTETVRRIETAFGWLDRMAANHATAVRLLPKLDSAILAKAFRGELVPQDPNDEPAAKLLERIKAERAAIAAKPQRRGRGRPPKDDKVVQASIEIGLTAIAYGNSSRPKGKSGMTKSRQDDDVMGKPYLAGLLKSGRYSDAQSLFRAADLPVADFYKQLAWEIDKGHILDNAEELRAA
jgi:type I restriction enzyme S subunit